MRPRQVLTLHGQVHYARALYECPRCRHSYAPLDAELGLLPHDRMTTGVAKKVAYAGAHASFPQAAKHLAHQLGLQVSSSECHRVAQQWGARLDAIQRQREAAWISPASRNSRPAPAERSPERVVVEADATSALTQRGEEHKMVYCATAFGLEDRVEKEGGREILLERRYAASGVDFEDFETRFRALAARLDAHRAQGVAFVGDGAPCLWRLAEEYLPRATVLIQDFWHVSEHLKDASRLVHGAEQAAASAFARWRLMLRESHVEEILEELRASARRLRGKRKGELQDEINYLEKGQSRMDYARYRSEGWLIGSGAVEGTCKHLVKERYNVTGARWKRDNIPFVLALRLSIFNEEWEEDWQDMRKTA